jgi:hypothetical protein
MRRGHIEKLFVSIYTSENNMILPIVKIISPISKQLKAQFNWTIKDRYSYVFSFCQVTISFGNHLLNTFCM